MTRFFWCRKCRLKLIYSLKLYRASIYCNAVDVWRESRRGRRWSRFRSEEETCCGRIEDRSSKSRQPCAASTLEPPRRGVLVASRRVSE
ncbi:hypothetical protein KGM_204763 [Danaus plexippus plexippus]|uniref:Uncharacterized protein n=1 Tax=Danaus plexippus plexippus TaxID=278856 RepID=A0A212FEC4_DANPL|nr:hypothetical protein KGM_204763 [Danaus plexippus plexippus]